MNSFGEPPKTSKPLRRGIFTAALIAAPFLTGLLAFLAGTTINFLPQAPIFQIDIRNLTSAPATQPHATRLAKDVHFAQSADNTSFAEKHHHVQNKDMNGRDVVPPANSPSLPPEFYNIYLWSYCTGAYSPASDVAATTPIWRVQAGAFQSKYSLNWCSSTTIDFGYNTVSSLQPYLPARIALPGYVVPDSLTSAIWVCGCIAYSTAGAMLLLSVLWAFVDKPVLRVIICYGIWIAALSVLVLSSSVTYLSTTSVRNWNVIGPQTGVAAFVGGVFIAMTWSSFGAFVLFNIFFTLRMRKAQVAAKADADLGLEMPLVTAGGPPGAPGPAGPWGDTTGMHPPMAAGALGPYRG